MAKGTISFAKCDVTDLAVALEMGTLSSPVFIDFLIDRIGDLDQKLGAFRAIYGENARRAAEAAQMARHSGHSVGPLQGIPIAFKDIIDVAGFPTSLGSAATAKSLPADRSADVVVAALGAGMIVLGKTNTVEFALGGWGLDPGGGGPRNPCDVAVRRVPGGSSSGSAVAVAAGLVPAAIGSDTGGSIRLPAAFCGVVGLKTTSASVPRSGVMELSATLDTVGPLVRSVRDAELMMAVLQGGGRSRVEDVLKTNSLQAQSRLDGCRLAVLPEYERVGVTSVVLDAFDLAVGELRKLGARVEIVTALPPLFELAELTSTIMLAEAYACHQTIVEDANSGMGSVVARRMAQGRETSARDYILALRSREEIMRTYRKALCEYDALIMPTTEFTAPPVAEVDQSKAPARFTRLANLVDCFAVSLPAGIDPHGLPIGLQLLATGPSESAIMRIGKAFQAVTEWHYLRKT